MLKKSVVTILFALFVVSLPQAQAASMDETLRQFETYAVTSMDQWKVPGMSVAVVKDDTIIYTKGFGTAKAGETAPITPDTVFQVGSVTKAFTVALMAQLVDQGVVEWDDRVVDHFPGFMMYDPWVTREFRIHDLFAQRSGMHSYAGDLQPFMNFDREHILHSLRFFKPIYSFRDTFSYVNNLFLAGAKVEELHTGKTWETLMRERLLTPLGMKRSSISRQGYEETTDKAVMHLLVDGAVTPMKPGTPIFDWPYIYGPAGGLNTSANDMARWLTAQMNNGKYKTQRIFSEQSAAFMHTPMTPASGNGMIGAYCQGWLRQHLAHTEIIWHNGNVSGGKSFIGFSPSLHIGIVILTNLGNQSLPDALGFQFLDMVSGTKDSDWNSQFLPVEHQSEPVEAPAQLTLPGFPLATYAGAYANPVYGDMTVKQDADALVITLGAQQQFTIRATHVTAHVFSGNWKEISPHDPMYEFIFNTDAAGQITGVTMPDLADGSETEIFTRQ